MSCTSNGSKTKCKTGRTVRSSVDRGFARSWRTIVAADLVSLIGAGALWALAIGSVKGFALFLGLSTIIDLVVSYFFMHPLVSLLARRPNLVRMPRGRDRRRPRRPDGDGMTATSSAAPKRARNTSRTIFHERTNFQLHRALVALGAPVRAACSSSPSSGSSVGGLNLGIDFTGGRLLHREREGLERPVGEHGPRHPAGRRPVRRERSRCRRTASTGRSRSWSRPRR